MSVRIATDRLIDYTVQQVTQKFSRVYPGLAQKEALFTQFNKEVRQLGQTLQTNLKEGVFVQHAKEFRQHKERAVQLKQFSLYCDRLCQLSQNLESAVAVITPIAEGETVVRQIEEYAPNALAALQKTDEYVVLKMKELQDKKKEVDSLQERMQKTYQEAEVLMKSYEQLIVQAKGGGVLASKTTSRPVVPNKIDDDWELLPYSSASHTSSFPTPTFPSFTGTAGSSSVPSSSAMTSMSTSSFSSSSSSISTSNSSESTPSSSSSIITSDSPSLLDGFSDSSSKSSLVSSTSPDEDAQLLDAPRLQPVTDDNQKLKRCETFTWLWRTCTSRSNSYERQNTDT